ncbi:MAG: VirD4-like conjugal transfer protein, CD1115 family [Bacillota bacterium]
MPVVVLAGLVLLLLTWWLFRKQILTWQHYFATAVVSGLFLLDLLLTVPLSLLPRTLWPPLNPEMTWAEIVVYLLSTTPEGGNLRWWDMTRDIFRTRPPAFWLSQITFVLAVLPLLRWAWGFDRPGSQPRAAGTATHGSTRWQRGSEFKTTLHSVSCDRPEQDGVVVGSTGRTAWVTRAEAGNPHVLLLGATRSGKSRRVIMPSVWVLGHAGESMILTDPKGEIYAHTAGWLRQKGYRVVLLDLLHPARGNRWNPLAAVARAHELGDKEEAARLAWEVGHILAWSEGPGTDPIWPQAEESLTAALCLAAAIEAPQEARHMATAHRMLIELGHRGGEALDAWFESLPSGHPARSAYGTAALSESRTRASIYTGTAAHLRLWGDPGIAWMCAASDHDPAEAGTRPMAIFLLMPDEAGARRYIASLYINQAYSALAHVARRNGGKLPLPVWFLLDEFGNIGKLPAMAEKLTVAAGRNIRFVLAVQAVAQIAHVYGEKTAEIVLGNCDTWLYLRTADIDTARVISAKAGTYTVRTLSVQRRPGLSGAGTEGATSRALLTPDEVLRWPSGQGLLLQAGQFPARLPLGDLSYWRQANGAFRVNEPLTEAPRVVDVPTWIPGGSLTGVGPVYRETGGEAVADRYAKDIFGKR